MTSKQDYFVSYLVVRQSLKMSIGKTAAQTAHASLLLHLKFIRSQWINNEFKMNDYRKWCDGDMRKVVLRADEKEWAKIKNELINDMVIVVDAGITELEPNTETVIGVWPMRKSQVPRIIKRLQVLK